MSNNKEIEEFIENHSDIQLLAYILITFALTTIIPGILLFFGLLLGFGLITSYFGPLAGGMAMLAFILISIFFGTCHSPEEQP